MADESSPPRLIEHGEMLETLMPRAASARALPVGSPTPCVLTTGKIDEDEKRSAGIKV
jgi:hypothetical protein